MVSLGRRNLFIFAVVPVALSLSFVFSAVLVYYPITVAIQPTSPPVVLVEGKGANKPDLMGVVGVGLGAGGSSLTIVLHPTYQITYYWDVAEIRNGDRRAYNMSFVVASPVSLPSGGRAILYLYKSGAARSPSGWPPSALSPSGYLTYVDLASAGMRSFSIGAGEILEMDILIYQPEGSELPNMSATLYLGIYP